MYEILIIRGAPGVGKSTLASKLRKEFPSGVTVETDHIRAMINSVKWVNTEEHLHALDATWEVCRSYRDCYTPITVIDTFSPSKLKYFISKFDSESVPVNYLVISLYCTDEELKRRILNRPSGYKEVDNCLILNHEVAKYRHANEIHIDTTHLQPREVQKLVLEALNDSSV